MGIFLKWFERKHREDVSKKGLLGNWFENKHIEDIVDSYTDANGNTDIHGAYASMKRRGYDSDEDMAILTKQSGKHRYEAMQRSHLQYDEDVEDKRKYVPKSHSDPNGYNEYYDINFNSLTFDCDKEEFLKDNTPRLDRYGNLIDYAYCDVIFPGHENYYAYRLQPGQRLEPGDKVLVAAGVLGIEKLVGEVRGVDETFQDLLPFPLSKMRYVLKRCNENKYIQFYREYFKCEYGNEDSIPARNEYGDEIYYKYCTVRFPKSPKTYNYRVEMHEPVKVGDFVDVPRWPDYIISHTAIVTDVKICKKYDCEHYLSEMLWIKRKSDEEDSEKFKKMDMEMQN